MTSDNTLDWSRLLEWLEPVHDRVRASARRLAGSCADGDDLFQDAVLRAVRKLPTLRDPERFGAWFYAVLLSVHRNRARRSFWRRLVGLERLMESGFEPTQVEVGVDDDLFRSTRLSRAMSTLPAVQREAIVLHDLDGYTMEDVARMQRVTVSAVKTRVSRGRARLRGHYERIGVDSGGASSGDASTNRAPGVDASTSRARGGGLAATTPREVARG